MRLPLITSLAFLCATFSFALLSHGTRDTGRTANFHVEPIRSMDGSFELSDCPSSPIIDANAWRYDRSRAIRASLYASSIVIETNAPLRCFVLSGPYDRIVRMGWIAPTTLAFVSVAKNGSENPFVVDVVTLSHEKRSVQIRGSLSRFRDIPAAN